MRYSEMSVKINERPEIKALREKAEAAQAEYMSAFDKAAAEEDPKLLQEWKVFQGETQSGSRSGSAASRGYDSLSDDEKKRLADLTSQVVGDPAVKAARAARRDAKTDEERKSAQTEYRSAIRKAILEIDKSAEAIFNKMDGKAPAGSDDGTSE